jgi:hypothetical protein
VISGNAGEILFSEPNLQVEAGCIVMLYYFFVHQTHMIAEFFYGNQLMAFFQEQKADIIQDTLGSPVASPDDDRSFNGYNA